MRLGWYEHLWCSAQLNCFRSTLCCHFSSVALRCHAEMPCFEIKARQKKKPVYSVGKRWNLDKARLKHQSFVALNPRMCLSEAQAQHPLNPHCLLEDEAQANPQLDPKCLLDGPLDPSIYSKKLKLSMVINVRVILVVKCVPIQCSAFKVRTNSIFDDQSANQFNVRRSKCEPATSRADHTYIGTCATWNL
jgi:hypothetical protein